LLSTMSNKTNEEETGILASLEDHQDNDQSLFPSHW
jgi:hypothetical protein